LDGYETICPAYEDPAKPGCLKSLTCEARTTGTDGNLCPSHSVCPKECASNEKLCLEGFDDNDCKLDDLCIPIPQDLVRENNCENWECPPKCDEEVQKYCQGVWVERGSWDDFTMSICPGRDYCVDRPLDDNGIRCPGHCIPDCGNNYVTRPQTGKDTRGCPLADQCEEIVGYVDESGDYPI
jgi:hypothetical protein